MRETGTASARWLQAISGAVQAQSSDPNHVNRGRVNCQRTTSASSDTPIAVE